MSLVIEADGDDFKTVNDELQSFSRMSLLERQRYPPQDEEDALRKFSFDLKSSGRNKGSSVAKIKLSLLNKEKKAGVSQGRVSVIVVLEADGDSRIEDEDGRVLASTENSGKRVWTTSQHENGAEKWCRLYVCATYGRLVVGSGSFHQALSFDFDPTEAQKGTVGDCIIWGDEAIGRHGVPSLFGKVHFAAGDAYQDASFRIFLRDWWERLARYQGVPKPWWTRLCDKESDDRRKKKTRDKLDKELHAQLRSSRPQRMEMIGDPVPLCVGDPYMENATATVMSRHRGRGFATKGTKTGKTLPDAYIKMEAGSATHDVNDPYIDVLEAERITRKKNNTMKLENQFDKRTGSAIAPRAFVSSSANDAGRRGAKGVLGEIYSNAFSEVTADNDQDEVRATLARVRKERRDQKRARNASLRTKAANIGAWRNIQTNPTKKGSFGVAGTLIDDKPLAHMAEPCTELALRDRWLAEQKLAREKRGDRPSFRPSGKRANMPGTHGPWRGGTFESVESAFGDTDSIARARRQRERERRGSRPQSAHVGSQSSGGGVAGQSNRNSNRPQTAGGRQRQPQEEDERRAFGAGSYRKKDTLGVFPAHIADPYPDRAEELRIKRREKMKAMALAELEGKPTHNLDGDGNERAWMPGRARSSGPYGTTGQRMMLRFVK